MKQKILGLITARGGSKRVPGKNIKAFLGKPLLAWSIETGKACGAFDRFVLSTEDEAIAQVGRENGIEVPFMRPPEYAVDTASSFDPVKHAFEWLRDNEGFLADVVVLLEPPAPGRQTFHIQEIIEIMQRDDVDSAVGVTKLPAHFHPEKVVAKGLDECIVRYHERKSIRESFKRNQEYSTLYYTNSSLYAFKPSNFYTDNPSLWGDRVYGYEMAAQYAFDTDTPEDWALAELKMKVLLGEGIVGQE